jgi:hypothetical protein
MPEEKKKIPPVADRLVYYAQDEEWPLFVDQHDEAHTFVGNQAVPISRANRLLTKLLYEREGRAPSNDGLIGARRVLDMLAHDSGEVRELNTRAAFYEGAVFYELAPGRVVRIDEHGWRLDPDPPAYFRAVKNLKSLPNPAPGSALEDITKWVNLKTDKDKRLFLALITLSTLPHIGRPILQTTGVMGSGKSTASRVVKRLLDPTANEAATIDKREFLQKAAHCYILVLDNQNYFPEWFQDTLCRLVTGESDSKRVLYTDEDDLIWSMMRAVVLNGINPPSDRGDIQDRTLPIELERLDKHGRMAEDDFWMQFSLEQPELLGAVFTALSGALKERHAVVLEERPRLADWGLYAAALYKAQGWGVDTFVEDWATVEKNQQEGTLDGSIVAQVIISYMKTRERVELSAAKLHGGLEDHAEDDFDLSRDKSWPKTGRTLWKKIREVTPLLEVHGIRAYRKNDNRAGRPIILDTDFTDPEPEPEGDPEPEPDFDTDPEPGEPNYAKYTDDNADDKSTEENYRPQESSIGTPEGPNTDDADDNLGLLSGSIPKEKKGQIGDKGEGESSPNLSSASSATPDSDDQADTGGYKKVRPLLYRDTDGGWTEDEGKAAVLGPCIFTDGPTGPITYDNARVEYETPAESDYEPLEDEEGVRDGHT